MVFDLRHRFSRKDRLGAVAAVILLPGALFLCLSLLKYTVGVAAPFDAAAPAYLAGRPVEYATFLTPFVAFLVAVVPILGLRLERSAGALRATHELEARPLNVLVALASGLVAVAFLGYLFLENVMGRMHVSP